MMWLLLEIDMLPSPTHSRHPTLTPPHPPFSAFGLSPGDDDMCSLSVPAAGSDVHGEG